MDQSLLESNPEELYKQLLLQASQENGTTTDPIARACVPIPGFCLKTKTENGEKVFINVCTGEHVPEPPEITDEELLKLLEAEDPTGYRVPLSLGEPHAEVDKKGVGCTAYDVIINPSFLEKVKEREILNGFFVTIVLEGIEHKYDTLLSREWTILKNRKFVGTLPEQNIRTRPTPLIAEMDGKTPMGKSLISEIEQDEAPPKPKGVEPPYTIIQEPPEGHPEFLVMEMHLSKVKSLSSVTLDIGEDRIVLDTRSGVYHLDIYLPYNLVQEECGAQFDRRTKILTITMPVVPPSIPASLMR